MIHALVLTVGGSGSARPDEPRTRALSGPEPAGWLGETVRLTVHRACAPSCSSGLQCVNAALNCGELTSTLDGMMSMRVPGRHTPRGAGEGAAVALGGGEGAVALRAGETRVAVAAHTLRAGELPLAGRLPRCCRRAAAAPRGQHRDPRHGGEHPGPLQLPPPHPGPQLPTAAAADAVVPAAARTVPSLTASGPGDSATLAGRHAQRGEAGWRTGRPVEAGPAGCLPPGSGTRATAARRAASRPAPMMLLTIHLHPGPGGAKGRLSART